MHRRLVGFLLAPRLWAALAGLLSLGLYLRTLAPSALWYDMAEFPTAAYLLGVSHNTGYPLYLLLGKLFSWLPFGDVAYRVNLLAAVAAALTVVAVAMLVWRLTRQRLAALPAALMLGASSTLWANATGAETYTLNALFTALLTHLLLSWQRSASRAPLLVACGVFGLAMGNHHLIQFFGAALAISWAVASWPRRRAHAWREMPALALCFLLGFSVNLYLPLRAAQAPAFMWADASQWRVFLRMITVGQASMRVGQMFALDPASLWSRLGDVGPALCREFTPVGLGLALLGIVRLARQQRALLLYMLLGSGLTALMVLTYRIHDILDYLLPVYVMMAIWIGVGLAALMETGRARLARRLAPGSAPRATQAFLGALTLLVLALPAHLVMREIDVLDRSQDDSSFLFANYLSGRVPRGGHVLADYWAWTPLVYYQTFAGWRDDLRLYAALSSPIDWPRFLEALQAQDDPIYVVAGGPLPPNLTTHALLHPVGIGVIETVTDVDVPDLRHKDLWLPLGNIYRVVNYPPRLEVDTVPEPWRLDEVRFAEELSLVGFREPGVPLYPGATPKLTYYWKLDKPTAHNYYVRVRLEDSSGRAQLLRGLPIWDHSHVIGGLTPTSTWQPQVLMGERYDALIPWRLKPGRYTVKAWVYQDEKAAQPLRPAAAAADGSVTLGHVEVLPRQGPFDVDLQEAPRE